MDYVAAKVIDIVKHLRELSPLYEMVKEGIDLTKIRVGGALRASSERNCKASAGRPAESNKSTRLPPQEEYERWHTATR